jgi:alkanesulfonate monooxygenase SsuD/methylene tetrahydromethanopterin reductase-like flavin-dependent oxidoreductase (luciferase family)
VTASRAMSAAGMELGVHLPLMEFGDEGQSWSRIDAATVAARECGFAAISANDHFLFATPWLDGPTALAAAAPRAGGLELATTIANVVLRGPVPLAKTLISVDALSEGGVVAGVGPGSSERDYDAVGIPFEERWPRFEEATETLRALLRGTPRPSAPRYYPWPGEALAPPPGTADGIPVWIGSWGSAAGLRRVARLADGWLASAYNITPEGFAAARERLDAELDARGRRWDRFPSALSTMWTWVTDDPTERERMLEGVLAPLLRRDPDQLRENLCVGPPAHCAEVLARYADAGCGRVYLWPLGDERRQLELVAAEVMPRLEE